MSSLRLALKQSLEESVMSTTGGSSSTSPNPRNRSDKHGHRRGGSSHRHGRHNMGGDDGSDQDDSSDHSDHRRRRHRHDEEEEEEQQRVRHAQQHRRHQRGRTGMGVASSSRRTPTHHRRAVIEDEFSSENEFSAAEDGDDSEAHGADEDDDEEDHQVGEGRDHQQQQPRRRHQQHHAKSGVSNAEHPVSGRSGKGHHHPKKRLVIEEDGEEEELAASQTNAPDRSEGKEDGETGGGDDRRVAADHRKPEEKISAAASKIQSHWKKKKRVVDVAAHQHVRSERGDDPSPSNNAGSDGGADAREHLGHDQNSEENDSGSHAVAAGTSTVSKAAKKMEKAAGRKESKTSPASGKDAVATRKAPDEKRGTAQQTVKKGKTVPPPAPEILDWVRNGVPSKRARKSVTPGLRVKVRFAAKVKKEGKVVKKKKWYGGRVSAVSKEGTKVRIKYDDGTMEVTKFPDKDVIIDDACNGTHSSDAREFVPPTTSDTEGPEVKAGAAPTGASGGDQTESAGDVPSAAHSKEGPPALAAEKDKVPANARNEEISALERDARQDPQTADNDGNARVKRTSAEGGPPAEVHAKEDDEIVPVGSTKAKRKRGRPPKALHKEVVDGRVETDHQQKGNEAPASPPGKPPETNEASPGKGHNMHDPAVDRRQQLPENEEKLTPKGSLPRASLKIRIQNLKAEGRPETTARDVLSSPHPTVSSSADVPQRLTGFDASVGKPLEKTMPSGAALKPPKDSLDDEGSPPAKRLHIHIPSKVTAFETMDSATGRNGRNEMQAIPSDMQAAGHGADSQDGKRGKAATATSNQLQRPAVESIKSPASPRSKKQKRKRAEADQSSLFVPNLHEETGHSTESKGTEGSVSTKGLERTDVSSKMFRVIDEERDPEGRPLTPNRARPKADGAPAARSGRRAAQQANERISAKQDGPPPDQVVPKKKRKKEKRADGEPDESEGSDDDSQWVQCDKCGKWRIIPSSVVPTLPKRWFCANNIWDPKRASCDAAEQTARQVAKVKKRKKRQKLLMQSASMGEDVNETKEIIEPPKSVAVKAPEADQSRVPNAQVESSEVVKKRLSPSDQSQTNEVCSSSEPGQNAEKKPPVSSLGKKSKNHGSAEGLVSLDDNSDHKVSKQRGRPRRSSLPVKESAPPQQPSAPDCTASQTEEADNLEWVQCEKCDKWRKLPPHISADELPDIWYCSMNSWNAASASCDAPEDKADGLQDVGAHGGTGLYGGKLSYRSLIFGNNGRKANRPVSERTRAAESIFTTSSEDCDYPPAVMYANSSAFVCRGKSNSGEENTGMSVLELMSHSRLWADLKGAVQQPRQPRSVAALGMVNRQSLPYYSFDALPPAMKESMKDLILQSLGTESLTGAEVLNSVQNRDWSSVPQGWTAVRSYCCINFVVVAMCELVKEGVLECVQNTGPNFTMKEWNPQYRRARAAYQESTDMTQSDEENPKRCMKFKKPWKSQIQ